MPKHFLLKYFIFIKYYNHKLFIEKNKTEHNALNHFFTFIFYITSLKTTK